jgi:hypothetical protein
MDSSRARLRRLEQAPVKPAAIRAALAAWRDRGDLPAPGRLLSAVLPLVTLHLEIRFREHGEEFCDYGDVPAWVVEARAIRTLLLMVAADPQDPEPRAVLRRAFAAGWRPRAP